MRPRQFLNWFLRLFAKPPPPSAEQRARSLISAIDAGGLPLNPARINDIARQLGMEVSSKAPMQDTIARIRRALDRAGR